MRATRGSIASYSGSHQWRICRMAGRCRPARRPGPGGPSSHRACPGAPRNAARSPSSARRVRAPTSGSSSSSPMIHSVSSESGIESTRSTMWRASVMSYRPRAFARPRRPCPSTLLCKRCPPARPRIASGSRRAAPVLGQQLVELAAVAAGGHQEVERGANLQLDRRQGNAGDARPHEAAGPGLGSCWIADRCHRWMLVL